MFIAVLYFFSFKVHAGKLGQVTDFTRGDTAMPGGLHARLCHTFLFVY